MHNKWLPLQSIINNGPKFILTDQNIWLEPLKEFKSPCKIAQEITAQLLVTPQGDGLLIVGKITGQLTLPCDRCMEDVSYTINHKFECFEPLPNDEFEDKENSEDVDPFFARIAPQGFGIEINLSALVWEEFTQALPDYSLCKDECGGLCAQCGANKNTHQCGCQTDNLDPRFAALRNLTIKK